LARANPIPSQPRTHLPPHSLSVFLPLCDLVPSNGPTEFQLGTHVRANMVAKQRFAIASCPAGSLVLYDPRIMHRGGPNESLADRPLIYMTFSRIWCGFTPHARRGRRYGLADSLERAGAMCTSAPQPSCADGLSPHAPHLVGIEIRSTRDDELICREQVATSIQRAYVCGGGNLYNHLFISTRGQ
jgi:hypothetical protein